MTQVGDDTQDFGDNQRCKSKARLIEKQQSRPAHQRPRERQHLPFAAGQCSGELLAAFAKARPALDAMAAKLYELGDAAGQGAAFKMINQLLAGVHIAAASEAIAFAAKQGLDIRKVYEVITASAGNSWMFENRMPHVLEGDDTPRSAVDIFVKDLGIALSAGHSAGMGLPLAAAAHQMFLAESGNGNGLADDSKVIAAYRRLNGIS